MNVDKNRKVSENLPMNEMTLIKSVMLCLYKCYIKRFFLGFINVDHNNTNQCFLAVDTIDKIICKLTFMY